MTVPDREVLLDQEAVDWGTWVWAPANPATGVPVLSVREWLDETEALLWHPDGPSSPEAARRLRGLLALVGGEDFPPGDVPWTLKLVHCPDPHGDVVPVMLAYLPAEGEPEQTLRALVRVGDPALVEPAIVEPVSTAIGNGLRGLAYTRADASGDGASVLLATIAYAWRVDIGGGVLCDLRLWTTWDPSRVIAVADDLDRLARALVFEEDGAR